MMIAPETIAKNQYILQKRKDYYSETSKTIVELGSKTINSGESNCNFYELQNTVLFELLLGKKEFVMIDMPEVMFRLKVASLYSLE